MKQLLYILTLSTMLVACNQTAQQTDEAHAHEANLQLTEYSNNMELFAEADPFAVGQNSGILAHFSWLENFKPLASGDVTVSLIIGVKGVKQTLSQPVRPGIYKFEIQPQIAGVGKIIFDINSKEGKSQIIVNNITVYDNMHDAEHAAEGIVVSETNATGFTKEQSWKIDFATEHPKVEPFGQVIKTTAQVESAQGDEILISAKTNGVVILSADDVVEGKKVTNGQIIFSISGSGLANNNLSTQYAEAKNNYEKTKSDYERLKGLAEDKIVSERDFLNAKNLYDNAKVNYDNLNQNFNASGQNVTSSMNGYVKQIFVQNGQYIEAGQPIVSISQNKTLLLKAEVQQKFAPVLGTINSANIRTLHNNQTYTLEQLNGKVLSFGRNTNKDNYLIPISLQIDNKGAFVSGGFVELFLKTQSNIQALTIPNAALLEEQGIFYVFVQVHPELFEKREVKVGVSDGIKTEIIKGVTAQERVVTTGAILVKLAQATGTLDAHSGHNH
jgi:RND family efflux transporter MFP subunit